MDPDSWQRLEEIFFAALESAPEQRFAVLDRECGGDVALRAEVEAMLEAHTNGTGPGLEYEPWAVIPDLVVSDARIGAYRIVELIGRGGMGEVYRAQRADDEYQQDVALKLVRSGSGGEEVARRFRVERQILAWLQHPNIAALLDGGVATDGRPYLVMQYVRGKPITAYCDAARLTIPERLRLFRTVCDAVQFAHTNLVVHRDLKPSNILVTDEGEVRLLDFGIAKLLDPQRAASISAASGDLRLLTPEHAAPEQLLGGAISTATDVYALGVLLYELLTGERPFRATSPLDLQRAVTETEALPPSVALARAGNRVAPTGNSDAPPSLQLAAAQRRTRPQALVHQLRGDLDQVVLMALRKEPERRYASAGQLGEDVTRYLEGWPVIARPSSLGYRARKFAVRHRTGVGAGLAVLLSLAAGLALALVGLVRAQQAERLALEEAATASQVSDFLVQLFRANEPGQARGETVTALELLDRGAARIDQELGDQPMVRARLLRTMGNAYEELGLFDPALALFERELALQRARGGDESLEVAGSYAELAGVHSRRGNYARARDLAGRSLAIQERARVPDTSDLLRALNHLAIAHGQLGDNDAARAALERALVIRERLHGPDHIELFPLLNNLAVVHWAEGDFSTARSLYERALALAERERGPDHPWVAQSLNNLALVHQNTGDLERAVAVHERALAIRQKVLDPGHPEIGATLNNLGGVYLEAEDFLRARPLLEEALAIRAQALGPRHRNTASSETNLGLTLLGLGDPEGARPLFERALASLEQSLGPDHVMVSRPLLGLARLEAVHGSHEAAERGFRRALALREAAMPPHHPEVLEALREYAAFLRDRGRLSEADALEERARQIPPSAPDGG